MGVKHSKTASSEDLTPVTPKSDIDSFADAMAKLSVVIGVMLGVLLIFGVAYFCALKFKSARANTALLATVPLPAQPPDDTYKGAYTMQVISETRWHDAAAVQIVEVGGHQFAVAWCPHGMSICEVTSASITKTNAEAQ